MSFRRRSLFALLLFLCSSLAWGADPSMRGGLPRGLASPFPAPPTGVQLSSGLNLDSSGNLMINAGGGGGGVSLSNGLSLDSSGNLLVNCAVGCGGGGSGTVNSATQYNLGYYPNSGSSAVVGGTSSITTDSLGDLNVAGGLGAATVGFGAGTANAPSNYFSAVPAVGFYLALNSAVWTVTATSGTGSVVTLTLTNSNGWTFPGGFVVGAAVDVTGVGTGYNCTQCIITANSGSGTGGTISYASTGTASFSSGSAQLYVAAMSTAMHNFIFNSLRSSSANAAQNGSLQLGPSDTITIYDVAHSYTQQALGKNTNSSLGDTRAALFGDPTYGFVTGLSAPAELNGPVDLYGVSSSTSAPSNKCRLEFNTTSGQVTFTNSSGVTCGPSGNFSATVTSPQSLQTLSYNNSLSAWVNGYPGIPVDATNPSSLPSGDRASFLNWTSGTAFALPAISGALASNFPFVLENTAGSTLTITPTSPNLFNGNATGTVLNNWLQWVYSDTAGPNWMGPQVPTFAAFGSTCANALTWSTTTGFGCSGAFPTNPVATANGGTGQLTTVWADPRNSTSPAPSAGGDWCAGVNSLWSSTVHNIDGSNPIGWTSGNILYCNSNPLANIPSGAVLKLPCSTIIISVSWASGGAPVDLQPCTPGNNANASGGYAGTVIQLCSDSTGTAGCGPNAYPSFELTATNGWVVGEPNAPALTCYSSGATWGSHFCKSGSTVSTGTATFAASTTVTGSGVTWTSAMIGGLVTDCDSTLSPACSAVGHIIAVPTSTTLTLDSAWSGSANSGHAYTIWNPNVFPAYCDGCKPGALNSTIFAHHLGPVRIDLGGISGAVGYLDPATCQERCLVDGVAITHNSGNQTHEETNQAYACGVWDRSFRTASGSAHWGISSPVQCSMGANGGGSASNGWMIEMYSILSQLTGNGPEVFKCGTVAGSTGHLVQIALAIDGVAGANTIDGCHIEFTGGDAVSIGVTNPVSGVKIDGLTFANTITGNLVHFLTATNGTNTANTIENLTWGGSSRTLIVDDSNTGTNVTSATNVAHWEQTGSNAYLANLKVSSDFITNVVGGCGIAYTGCNFILGSSQEGPPGTGGAINGAAVSVANTSYIVRINNLVTRKIGSGYVFVNTGVAAGVASEALYDSTGTQRWTTGSMAVTGSGATVAFTPTAYTMIPGVYYLVYCASSTTIVITALVNSAAGQPANLWESASAANTYGVTSDACSAGIVPGSITPSHITNQAIVQIAAVMITN